MMDRNSFICISTNCWNGKWERMQQISLCLANYGRVLYLEPNISIKNFRKFLQSFFALFTPYKFISKIKPNLYTFRIVSILPFGRFRFIKMINNYLIIRSINILAKMLHIKNSVLIIWDFWEADKFMGKINESLVVFDYYDNYVAYHSYSKKKRQKVRSILISVIKKSNIIFATSLKLLEEAKTYNPCAYLLPNGVDVNNYLKQKCEVYTDIKYFPHPIVGYMGGNNYETCGKLDYDLLLFLTNNMQAYSFVFLGPVDELNAKNEKLEILRKRKNVYFLGNIQSKELPNYLRQFDVCIIPWKLNDFTLYAYPLKLNEYLACGKPIVTTALPDLLNFDREKPGLIKIANSYEEFIFKINEAIKENNKELENKRIAIAKENSWLRRIEEILKIIEQKLESVEKV